MAIWMNSAVPKYVHWESKETALKFTLSIGWGRVVGQNWNDTLPSSQWAPIIAGFDLMHLFVAKIEKGGSVAPLWPQDDTYANISELMSVSNFPAPAGLASAVEI